MGFLLTRTPLQSLREDLLAQMNGDVTKMEPWEPVLRTLCMG